MIWSAHVLGSLFVDAYKITPVYTIPILFQKSPIASHNFPLIISSGRSSYKQNICVWKTSRLKDDLHSEFPFSFNMCQTCLLWNVKKT